MPANPSRLYQQLQNTGVQNKDTPMYQFLRALIDSVQAQFQIEGRRTTPIIPPPNLSSQPFITHQNAVAALPNSRNLLAGTNITFDDTTPNQRTINASGGGGGGDDYVVLSDGNINPGSDDSVGAHIYLSSNVTINDATPTTIDWENELIDQDNFWGIGSANTIVIPADGWYIVRGQVIVVGTSAGQTILKIIQDGTTEIARADSFFTPVNNSTQVAIHKYFNQGEFVELEVTITSGDPTTDIISGIFGSYFQILKPGSSSIAPSPVNDGFGNFIYVPYTP